MSGKIDDVVLISQFLEGTETPLLNRNLIIQTNSEAVQLYARWEGVIATFQRVQSTPTIALRKDSIYFGLIRELLIKRHFLPLQLPSESEFAFEQYRRHQIPADYTMNYTEAKLLWREWRFTWNERGTSRLRRGILLLSKDNWYPIQDIGFHQGQLVIRTLVSTLTVAPDAPMIWLSQTPVATSAALGRHHSPVRNPAPVTRALSHPAAPTPTPVRSAVAGKGDEGDTAELITATAPIAAANDHVTPQASAWVSPEVAQTPAPSRKQQLAAAVAATARYQQFLSCPPAP